MPSARRLTLLAEARPLGIHAANGHLNHVDEPSHPRYNRKEVWHLYTEPRKRRDETFPPFGPISRSPSQTSAVPGALQP
jgi:hypothetical protein